jgi:hypothetical protein
MDRLSGFAVATKISKRAIADTKTPQVAVFLDRPPPAAADGENSKNAVADTEISKGAVLEVLSFALLLFGTIWQVYQGALRLWEASIPVGLLVVLVILKFRVDIKSARGLDAQRVFRWHVGIGVVTLVAIAALFAYGAAKAQLQEWQRDRERIRLERTQEAKSRKTACEADRKKEINRLEKRKSEDHVVLIACTENERRKKPDDIHQRCWNEWNAFNTTEHRLKSVQARRCDGSSNVK